MIQGVIAVAVGWVGVSVAAEGPVKVFILSGQSNMVGAGKVDGGGTRWGSEMLEPVVSVYDGQYDATVDYDTLKPIKTLKLESFGGVKPTAYPGGGVQVVRGMVLPKETGVYEFRPGYGGSIMPSPGARTTHARSHAMRQKRER